MSAFTNNSVPEIQSYGGNTVIMRTSTDLAQSKLSHWIDKPRIVNFISNHKWDHVTNLGLINFASHRFHHEMAPMYKGWFEDKAIMELNGDRMRFEIPVESETMELKTVRDTSSEFGEAPGLNGQPFEIVLNKEFKAGRILTPDVTSGFQIIVSEDVPTRQELDGFRHTVTLVQNDKFKYFPTEYLKSDIEYFKGDGALGEMSTQFMGWDFEGATNTLKCEFLLGQKRGVESGWTEDADFRAGDSLGKVINGVHTQKIDVNNSSKHIGDYNDQVFMYEHSGKDMAKAIPSTVRIGTLAEILTTKELYRSESWGLIWNQAGKIDSINGGIKHVNEGLYWQFRRGYRFEYDLVDGITFDLLSEVNSLIFDPGFKMEDRMTHYEGGLNATENTKSIIQEAAISRLPIVQTMHGDSPLLPKGDSLVSGNKKDGYAIDNFKFSKVNIPGLGWVSVEHNPSFDYIYGQSRQERHRYGRALPYTSHTLMMRDWTNSMYSNSFSKNMEGARVIEGGDQGANIYYVRPSNVSNYTQSGWNQGRYSVNGQTSGVYASMQTMSAGFWIWRRSASFMKDPTKVVLIELKRDTYENLH